MGEHTKFSPVTHTLPPSVCCLCHLLVQRTPPTRAPSCFYGPAEHTSGSKPNTALEDPRNPLKFQYSGLDTQPQPETLRERPQGQQSTRGTKPSSLLTSEQVRTICSSCPWLPAWELTSLCSKGTESVPAYMEAGSAFLAGGASTAWTL